MSKQVSLVMTKVVPGKPGSGKLFEEEIVSNDGPVICLGMEFENDEARRSYFTEELRKKLQDPEFRKIEGFPIGKDEDILILSDPPYYTACPNPWISEFIEEWESQKPEKPADYHYHREPFAADVSEGKNDPIYNAHSYHTKVPHKAIMRYILHYTEPGDIVFDGFCGTGMTGVAAQMCGDRATVESLGYQVKSDGTILQEETDEEGKKVWKAFSKLGARKTVLNDLSPAATFIAYNYNTPVNVAEFEKEANRILKEVEEECGWMYETIHTDGKTKGKINYTVWSDVFVCPECTKEIIFWDTAVNKDGGKVLDAFPCPHCTAQLTKRKMERAWITKYDSALKDSIRQAKQVPVFINYSVGKNRFEKTLEEADLALIEKIENQDIPYWFPTNRILRGDKTNEPIRIGCTHTHLFYTKRNLYILALVFTKCYNLSDINLASHFLFNITAFLRTASKLEIYRSEKKSAAKGSFNHLYFPSLGYETNVIEEIYRKYKKNLVIFKTTKNKLNNCSLQISSSSSLKYFQSCSIDYIFLDPPFGSNIMYSELDMFRVAWFKLFEETTHEAIENKSQQKGAFEYRKIMADCFKEAYRILKPGHWITVEFSNTQASIWNSVRSALSDACFVVSNISSLDKQRGSYNSNTSRISVIQDLIISAYKPNGGFEERFEQEVQTEEGVWDFIRTHLKYLPVIKKQGFDFVNIPERDPRILYDQLIAYYVRKGYNVPIDSQDFQVGLSQRFSERDGMYFLSEHAAEYDRKKMLGGGRPVQLSLFVNDEASAIEWLRTLLRDKPQSFQDINPLFMKELSGWSKNEVSLELSTLLEQNFLCYDGKSDVPSQIHSYLSTNWPELRNLSKDHPALIAKAKGRWYVPDPNKAGDLEKLREKALLKEFEEYKQANKKLKIFRLEAVRAGFKKAWQERDYKVIISVSEKIPNNVLEEDPKLLMWYDQAVTRMGEE